MFVLATLRKRYLNESKYCLASAPKTTPLATFPIATKSSFDDLRKKGAAAFRKDSSPPCDYWETDASRFHGILYRITACANSNVQRAWVTLMSLVQK